MKGAITVERDTYKVGWAANVLAALLVVTQAAHDGANHALYNADGAEWTRCKFFPCRVTNGILEGHAVGGDADA